MRHCVLLSFLLALVVGHTVPTSGVNQLPAVETQTTALQVLLVGDYTVRLNAESEDGIASDSISLPFIGPPGSLPVYAGTSPFRTTTTPYAIRAPPLSTAL